MRFVQHAQVDGKCAEDLLVRAFGPGTSAAVSLVRMGVDVWLLGPALSLGNGIR